MERAACLSRFCVMTLAGCHRRLVRSHPRWSALPLALAATWLALVVLPSGSLAELSGYSTPMNLSARATYDAQVAVDREGRATVVWQVIPSRQVKAVRLDPAGNPGPIRTLSRPGQDAGDPEVAVDAAGRATVVWRFGPNAGRVQTVRLDAAGKPGPVHTLSRQGDLRRPQSPQVAVDSEGRATVVWAATGVAGTCAARVVKAVRLDSAGNPGQVQTLSEWRDSCDIDPSAQVAVDPGGRATVVWSRTEFVLPCCSNHPVEAVRLDAAGNPGPVQTLSEPGFNGPPGVAVDPEGRATVVWERRSEGSNVLGAVRLDAAGNPSPVQTLSEGDVLAEPQVAVDSEGRATIVWQRVGPGFRVGVARLDADGNLGVVETLARGRDPQVAVDPEGRATVVWRSRLQRDGLIQAARLGPTGSPGPIQTLSEGLPIGPHVEVGPQVAVAPDGRATVVWRGSNGRVQATHSLRLFEAEAEPRRRTVGPRKQRVTYVLRATNRDTEPSGLVRLCASTPEGRVKVLGERCRAFAEIAPGASAERLIRLKILDRARGGLTKIELLARGPNVEARTTARLKVRR
jgi:hypothetical protein